jgi:hypothetical protein
MQEIASLPEALLSLSEKLLQDLSSITETGQCSGRILNIGRWLENQALLCFFEDYSIALLDSKFLPKRGRDGGLTFPGDPGVIRCHESYEHPRTTTCFSRHALLTLLSGTTKFGELNYAKPSHQDP